MNEVRAVARGWNVAFCRHLAVLGTVVSVLILGADPARAAPRDEPSDIGGEWTEGTAPAPVLPQPPDDYRAERRGRVQWVYPDNMVDEARDLQGSFDHTWKTLTGDLGTELDRGMIVRVARNPEEMRELAPRGHPPPPYATGVAYPPFGVVLLTMTAPESWKRPDIDAVLTHELSHIALWRAVDGQSLPQWFVEGVAIHQADEYSIARTQALWEATVRDELIPLSRLSDRFPSRPYEVNIAYAQAADIVNYLRKDEVDAHRFRKLIRHARRGEGFEQALRSAYFVSVEELETQWHANLQERFQALPLVLGGGTLWALAGLFVLLAYVRRKRQAKKKLHAMAEEEAVADRLSRAAAQDPPAEAEDDEEELHGDDERMVVVVSGDPPQGREPEVPTVQYEGRDHTLH